MDRLVGCIGLSALLLSACGKPVDDDGREDARFTKASMSPEMPADPEPPKPADPAALLDPNRTLSSEVGVQLIAWTVVFDRLHTPELITAKLNHTPGRLSRVDLDKDGTPDPLTVTIAEAEGNHNVEIRSKTTLGEFVIVTIIFDAEWQLTGYFEGRKDSPPSTYANPLPVAA